MTIPETRTTDAAYRPGPGRGDEARDVVPRDDVRDVLRNERRRELLGCVLAAEDPVAVRTLVGHVADVENSTTVETSLLERRQRVHTSLIRTHLPLLADLEVIEYDENRGLVAPTFRLAAFEPYLEGAAPPRED